MTTISYIDNGRGRFTLKCEGHADRVNEDDHNVICACVSTVITGLLGVMPDYLAAERIEDDDGDGLTVEADGNYIRVEPGYAEFDITADDPTDAEFFHGAFEHAVRCFQWIEREWPRQVRVEY